MNTHLFSYNNLSEKGWLKLFHSSAVQKKKLVAAFEIEGEKRETFLITATDPRRRKLLNTWSSEELPAIN